ncbi:hypothetical protein NliqN6_1321 [Naganishia liquefaciens]|uniref:Survival Motor Neuron Gemin2-binding domain-containing protein n=1 Tax=Naganishia liquefaciens TaxID=104408 RepID=A0A8H3TRG9_9TREE|nr:hypothetical protein NliqN6_1321 [Naganishia liquefaciens]
MSDLGSDDLEAYAERTGIPLAAPAAAAVVGEAITLDLGSGSAAWDDSELVNAWDAAAEEFKLHNPGPGTWLDKATAALAVGRPLPGAQHGESNIIRTRWYTETRPARPTAVNPYAQPSSSHRGGGGGGGGGAYTEPPAQRKKSTVKSNLKRKRKRESQMAAQAVQAQDDEDRSVDMSLDEETVGEVVTRDVPASPAYTPNSPTLYSSTTTPAGPALPSYLAAGTITNPYLRQPEPTHQPAPPAPPAPPATATATPTPTAYPPTISGIYPSMGSTSNAAPLTREEATTRAVNAQWWAGYWFAMSEVMPSVAQVEQTQQQGLQR